MFRSMPDWIGIPSSVGYGTDSLTQDFKPKKVYYAMKDLFDSWRAKGNAVTDANGKVSFKGLGGTYSIGVTTAEGLLQTFEMHLGPESRVVTVILDGAKAVKELQQLVLDALKRLDWSKRVGMILDYNSYNSRLNEARSALAKGDYGKARSIAEAILETTAISIDGNPDDWRGIKPIATLPQGGVKFNAPGIDIKALYGMRDDKYLYMMVEVYDPPITLQPGGIDTGGIANPMFNFIIKTDTSEDWHYCVATYLPYTGQMDVYDSTGGVRLLATLYTVAYSQVLELKVPLALLDNPSRISVSAYVTALAEDGERKGAKAFDDYVQEIGP